MGVGEREGKEKGGREGGKREEYNSNEVENNKERLGKGKCVKNINCKCFLDVDLREGWPIRKLLQALKTSYKIYIFQSDLVQFQIFV